MKKGGERTEHSPPFLFLEVLRDVARCFGLRLLRPR